MKGSLSEPMDSLVTLHLKDTCVSREKIRLTEEECMANERSTSVWDALVDSPEEAENLRVRSQLMRALTRTVKSWELSQKEAAERLHVTQPRLNDLLKGKIDKFSLDALVNMLAGANLQIEIEVKERKVA